jgi:Na+-transporting NADH:ubiquinone oxidoreductase subunit C
MKNFSNRYIFIFSIIMVTIVAATLAVIASLLKDRQQQNIKVEQMQSILSAVNIESSTSDALAKFEKYIVGSYVVDADGEKIENRTVFDVDMKTETDKIQEIKKLKEILVEGKQSPFKKFMSGFINFEKVDKEEINREIKEVAKERELPVYECKVENEIYYIFPVRGKGLWGPIWGYVALKNDFNTIYGANFDHKGETPGLGAEINETWFEDQFKGKKIMEDGKFVSIKVLKGEVDPDNPHSIDAISGGTITSKGLEAMLFDCLNSYQEFFNVKKSEQ